MVTPFLFCGKTKVELGTPPPPSPARDEEILHVGDGLAADFCGARAAGLQAVERFGFAFLPSW